MMWYRPLWKTEVFGKRAFHRNMTSKTTKDFEKPKVEYIGKQFHEPLVHDVNIL